MKLEKPPPLVPFIRVGEKTRFLNVPHAGDLAHELFEEDCYYLDRLPDGAMVFDVGACYGMFGLTMAGEKNCKVAMYEPALNNWTVAGLNYQLNAGNFDPEDVMIFRCGIAGQNKMETFSYCPGHPAGSGFLIDTPFKEEIEVFRLSDQIMFRRELGRPVVVKLDCEGSEGEIFDQDPGWIDMVDIITMEWHYHVGDRCRDILLGKGFEVEITGCGLPRPPWNKNIERGMLFAKKISPSPSVT